MKKKKSLLGTVFFLIIILAAAYALCQLYIKHRPSKEVSSMEEIYGVSGDDVSIIYNYAVQKANGIYRNDAVYIPLNWVQAIVNKRFYWDSHEKLLVYTFPESIEYASAETLGSSGKPLIYIENDKVYILAELVDSYSDVNVDKYIGDTKRVYVSDIYGEYITGVSAKNTVLRTGASIKDSIELKLSEGVQLDTVDNENYNEESGWYKVVTEDGYMGYVQAKKLKRKKTSERVSSYIEPVYTSISMEGKVVLAWHQVTNMSANKNIDTLLQNAKGVNVISPTWFSLSDDEGNISSYASSDYVTKLHDKGIQVWALVDNFSGDGDTYSVLSKTSSRQRLIEQLIDTAIAYNIDGINVDFETISSNTASHYIQFIRELSVFCRNKGLVLSVDNPNYASYNSHYDREEQGIVADYVINMGYDEHYAGSSAGSVASYSFVKQGIEDSLNEVSSSKLINAIPFYTRLWSEGGSSLGSSAMGINKEDEWIAENSATVTWDENAKQNYAEVTTTSGKQYMWIEDIDSLELKLGLIKENDLAGVACWRLGFETAEIWDAIDLMLD